MSCLHSQVLFLKNYIGSLFLKFLRCGKWTWILTGILDVTLILCAQWITSRYLEIFSSGITPKSCDQRSISQPLQVHWNKHCKYWSITVLIESLDYFCFLILRYKITPDLYLPFKQLKSRIPKLLQKLDMDIEELRPRVHTLHHCILVLVSWTTKPIHLCKTVP